MNKFTYQTCLILITSFLYSSHSRAADFCVANSTEFQAALSDAASNGEADHIKMKSGNYPIIGGNRFAYITSGTLNTDLKISGGWGDLLGGQCNFRSLNASAFDTTINGLGLHGCLDVQIGGIADFEISAVAFLNGRKSSEFNTGGGVNITALTGYTGEILIENSAFISNEANFGSALSASRGYKITVRNNLFTANHSPLGSTITLVNGDQRGIYFTNNTVMDNTTDGSNNNTAAVHIVTSGDSKAFIANNIIWNNEFKDLYFSGDVYLYNNNLGPFTGTAIDLANNFSGHPKFDHTISGNAFTPAYNSNLHNQGIEPPLIPPVNPPFELDWKIGANDTFGRDRIINGQIDIGSVETPSEPPIFEDGFEIF